MRLRYPMRRRKQSLNFLARLVRLRWLRSAKMGHLQRLLDRFLATRPTGLAKNSRLVLVAVYLLVRESFQLYADICEVLAVLLESILR
ncbi:hypothetical protein ACFX2F_030007 [Malus domestica]